MTFAPAHSHFDYSSILFLNLVFRITIQHGRQYIDAYYFSVAWTMKYTDISGYIQIWLTRIIGWVTNRQGPRLTWIKWVGEPD